MLHRLPCRAPSILASILLLALGAGPLACATSTPVGDPTGGGAGGGGGRGGSGGGETGGTGGATTGTPSTSSTTGPFTYVESACPAGSFATGTDLEHKLVCQPLMPMARDAINKGCSLYFGWRDSCTGCDLEPTKWGKTSPAGCINGAGPGNSCTGPALDGAAIQLIGLDLDGNVNEDDKFYLGLHCPAVDATPAKGPCEMGSYAASLDDGETTCIPAAAPVIDHIRARCGLYFGWRDSCNDCTSAPDRWGHIGPAGCTIGAGDTGTCKSYTLADNDVELFGLNPGGDVDNNDKLYLALYCQEAQAASTMTKGSCPAGQLITAVAADGTLTCESPASAVANYFDEHCTFYFGWRDGCGACEDPPSKWGRVKNGFCTNDNGVDNTCTQTILGGTTVEMFGLNPDGDVDDSDKLYMGFRCD